jgi:hypothetical protein
MIDNSQEGKRVELVKCNDPYTELKSGDKGTIQFMLVQSDSHICENQLCVNWDNGSNLMLLQGKDSWRIID